MCFLAGFGVVFRNGNYKQLRKYTKFRRKSTQKNL